MIEEEDWYEFYPTANKIGSSIMMTIPKTVVQVSKLQEGTKLKARIKIIEENI